MPLSWDLCLTTYEARMCLNRGYSALILSGELPDLAFYIREIRENDNLGYIPIGVVGGGPEILETGADDILYELSEEAVNLLLARVAKVKNVRDENEKDVF